MESKHAWGPLKDQFTRRGWPHTRIENSAEPGTPDVIVSVRHEGQDREVWIELKHVKRRYGKAQRDEWAKVSLGLRDDQFLWLRAAFLMNRDVCIVAAVENRWYMLKSLRGFELAKGSATLFELETEGVICSTPSAICDSLVKHFLTIPKLRK